MAKRSTAAVITSFLALTVVLTTAAQTGQTSSAHDAQPLQPGPPVSRSISGSDVHAYTMRILSGQYVRVAIEPRGSVLHLKLSTPQGAKLFDLFAPNAAQDATRLSLIAQESGPYLIELNSTRNDTMPKQYAIGIEDLHDATSVDRDRVAAETLFAEANSLVVAGRADALVAAIDKYRAALVAWRKLDGRREEARTLLNLGSVSHNLSRGAEALDYYAQALSIWRALGDRGKEAQTLSGMGWTYYSIGELQKALQNYNLALPIRREIKDLRGQAQTLTTVGQIYHSLGEPQQAIIYFDQALPLAREAGDKVQEAFALNSYALLYVEMGEYEKALDCLERGLPLWRETGNRYGEADALNSLGLVYRDLGDFEKSVDYYERALKLYRFVGYRQGEGNELNNIGIVYWNEDSLGKALVYLNQALTLRIAIGQKPDEAATLDNLGLVYEDLGEGDKALDHFTRALAIDPTNGATLSDLARNSHLRGDNPRAMEYADRALAMFRERGDKADEAGILGLIAEVQAAQGKLDEALVNSRYAVEMFETIRARLVAPERRTSLNGFSKSYYSLLIDILSKLDKQRPFGGYDAAALEVSERARSRGLLDLLREARVDIRERVDPALLDRERTLQRLLNSKEQYRTRLLANKGADAERTDTEKEIASLLIDYENTLAKIRASSPEYAALTQPDTLRLKEIQQTVLDENSILLEYYLGLSDFLWVVTPTSISMHKLPPRVEIETEARQVYDSLVSRNIHPPGETPEQRLARVNKADARYEEASAKLSETLLGPVVDKLGKKRLLLVTEGWLQYIPFSALPTPRPAGKQRSDSRGQPLIMDHEIVNLPSASVLALLRKELVSRKLAPKPLAVFADPVFSRDDPRVALKDAQPSQQRAATGSDNESDVDQVENRSRMPKFGRLRFSREEADGIAALAAKSEILEATDFAATKEVMVNANLQQYRILHFATHSLLNSRWPELSGVVLSLVDQRGEPQDGFLRLNEIYNLRLNAELVVLSGCQTALGKETKGEGLVGLARGFMYAGAPRVVASLWSVDDRATAELMKRFYKAVLIKRIPPAAALRAAQVDLLSDKGWNSPYYWAAFTIQGEWK